MSYGGENTVVVTGWGGSAGAQDEPFEVKFNQIIPLRFQISASEQMAPADTTVETANTQKLTIPAGTFKTGDRAKVRAWGKVTAANGADTFTGRIRIGGVAGIEVAAKAAYNADANDYVRLDADLWIETQGAAAASKTHAAGKAKATGEAEDETYVVDSTALDTTIANDIVVTQDWSVDNAGNRFKLYELELVLYRTRQAWS